jgi:hypothetical protein
MAREIDGGDARKADESARVIREVRELERVEDASGARITLRIEPDDRSPGCATR